MLWKALIESYWVFRSGFLSWIKSISYTKLSNFRRHFLRMVNCSRRSLFFWLWTSRRCFPIAECFVLQCVGKGVGKYSQQNPHHTDAVIYHTDAVIYGPRASRLGHRSTGKNEKSKVLTMSMIKAIVSVFNQGQEKPIERYSRKATSTRSRL